VQGCGGHCCDPLLACGGGAQDPGLMPKGHQVGGWGPRGSDVVVVLVSVNPGDRAYSNLTHCH
jgi:hypothetical protein